MLRDMLTDIVESQPDMKIVGESDRRSELPDAVEQVHPDIVIVAQTSDVDRHSFDDLLYAAPRLKVLAIVDNNRLGLLYELQPYWTLLGEMSPGSLVAAVRSAGEGEAPSGVTASSGG